MHFSCMQLLNATENNQTLTRPLMLLLYMFLCFMFMFFFVFNFHAHLTLWLMFKFNAVCFSFHSFVIYDEFIMCVCVCVWEKSRKFSQQKHLFVIYAVKFMSPTKHINISMILCFFRCQQQQQLFLFYLLYYF